MIGRWLGGVFDTAAKNWKDLVLPGLAMTAMIFLPVFVLVLVLMVPLMALGEGGEPSPAVMVGVISLMVVAVMGISPLMLGMHRGCLSLVRGQGWPRGALLSGFDHAIPAIVLFTLTLVLTIGGSMLCYLPGLLVGALLMFSMPIMADTRCGPIEAMRRSAEMAQGKVLWLAFYSLFASLIVGIVTQFPVVGLLASFPLSVLLLSVPYAELSEAQEGSKPSISV
jgi:uncharacterized membrane protein